MPVFRWTALLALLSALLSVSSIASAATLPGLPLVFDIDGDGTWTLADDQPKSVLQAGCEPGWVLTAVDGRPVDDGLALQRRVAAGPARSIQLQFSTGTTDRAAVQEDANEAEAPAVDVIVIVPRSPLVVVEQIGIVPWPNDFVPPAGPWQQDFGGTPALVDAGGLPWLVHLDTGGLERVDAPELSPRQVPALFFSLSDATWVIDRSDAVTSGDSAWAAQVMAGATRVQTYQGRAADHLLVPMAQGLEVLEVQWPLGTPQLPVCTPLVPETCLASGKQILAQLDGRPGARDEALRQLGLACSYGVHRACYEAVAIEDPSLSERANACVSGDVAACNSVAERRLSRQPDSPDDLVLGLLDYACEMEGSGSLGERLRRLEDVGAGCMMLSHAYDLRGMPDRALLNLDQACVLGRADACEQAAQRRHQAFAARTIRECEDEKLPIAASCVEQGRLLQTEDIEAATLDDFDAFLRGCTLGAIDGCVLLGDYVDRWGIENPRVVRAETQLRRACNDGEQRACMGAAHLLVRHDPKTDAYGAALKLFTQACYDGLATACVAGAEQRRIGQAHKIQAPDQVTMWTKACDASDAPGCAGLGQRLVRSRKTWPETFAAWTKACDLGDAQACTQLGLLVKRHHPEPWPGEQEQDRYLGQACDNDDAEGCYWLAEDDIPRKGEPSEAAYLLLARSCEGEYGPGCAELADVHLDRKTSFDDEIAARHLDTACANGHYDSCRVLGSMYLRGKGVERDRARAQQLLDRFRMNAPRKHVRLGLSGGFPVIAGAEAELVLPIPVGPALSLGGTYSWIPSGGAAFIVLRGDGQPSVFPDLQVLTMTARVYPNTQARGIWGGIGVQRLTASGGDLTTSGPMVRSGLSVRLGFRNDKGNLYTGLEIGAGNYGVVDVKDFDSGDSGLIPLILPTMAFSVGTAFL